MNCPYMNYNINRYHTSLNYFYYPYNRKYTFRKLFYFNSNFMHYASFIRASRLDAMEKINLL